jgi:hypothetical protein
MQGPNEQNSQSDYLQLLHQIVADSTVCLMQHERRQTLAMIQRLMYQVRPAAHPTHSQPSCYRRRRIPTTNKRAVRRVAAAVTHPDKHYCIYHAMQPTGFRSCEWGLTPLVYISCAPPPVMPTVIQHCIAPNSVNYELF